MLFVTTNHLHHHSHHHHHHLLGELVYKYPSIVRNDPNTVVIVNCAGRTRSIIGTQSLINAGFGRGGKKEKKEEEKEEEEEKIFGGVFACQNGTMGWCLEGLEVERGAERRVGEEGGGEELGEKMREVRERYGVKGCSWEDVVGWEREREGGGRGVYVFDVRLPEEYEKGFCSVFVFVFVFISISIFIFISISILFYFVY